MFLDLEGGHLFKGGHLYVLKIFYLENNNTKDFHVIKSEHKQSTTILID